MAQIEINNCNLIQNIQNHEFESLISVIKSKYAEAQEFYDVQFSDHVWNCYVIIPISAGSVSIRCVSLKTVIKSKI